MVQTARLFLAGSSIYPALELLYRKKTHVSMAGAGGTSLCFINKVCNGLLKQKSLPVKCVAGSFIIILSSPSVGRNKLPRLFSLKRTFSRKH